MKAIDTYISQLQDRYRRQQTTPETAHYDLLSNLLNEIGQPLDIYAVSQLKNVGAGTPDLGLFHKRQIEGGIPDHGVIEAKGTAHDLQVLAASDQVKRYAAHYGQVLVTNYYQFLLVIREPGGTIRATERFDLAANEAEFHTARSLAEKHHAALTEYLLRVMRRNTLLSTPQDIAWILASYAREAKARIERPGADLTALRAVRDQLEQALGVKFNDAEGEEFFRSTLVQTLFYGVFSAWVLWHETHARPTDRFDLWRDIRDLNLPAITEIFAELTKATSLRPLDIEDLLEYTVDALNRVDRAAFFERFATGDAVQYFYEPFLEAFDPKLRKQLGVWYTPREVVEYMVARVDTALREELNIPDGLADPSVYVLDPCCGTGAYLVEVLNFIYKRLQNREGDLLAAQAVAHAIRERIFGFEILPAPFVVAHLQLGILLNNLQAPLQAGQRAGVYLTNALTGWEPATAPRTMLMFPELQKERDAADAVKQKRPILVILGNPPYSGFAGTAIDEERMLTDAYRITKHAPRPQGQGLNDLYVRFYRMAERGIVEKTGRGVICFISNYSWLDGLSHTGMRERYLEEFDQIFVDSLNGDKFRTGKRTPDNKPDPSIFSTEFNAEGIQVGTAITLLVRKTPHENNNAINYRDLWGNDKRTQLQKDIQLNKDSYQQIVPQAGIGFPYLPRITGQDYPKWTLLSDLYPTHMQGVITGRDEVFIDIDQDKLLERMNQYFDKSISNERMEQLIPRVMKDANRFQAKSVRDHLLNRGFLPDHIVRYCYRPFDVRWIYFEPETKLLVEKSPDFFKQARQKNYWIEVRQRQTKDFDRGYFTRILADSFGNGCSLFFPMYIYDTPKVQHSFLDLPGENGRKLNLTEKAQKYLTQCGADEQALFYHTLAILHSPAYRAENAGALQQDFPRVPLPAAAELLTASAALGRQIATLLDVETPVPGVTSGDPRPDLAEIGKVSVLPSPFDGEGQGVRSAPNFAITAGWGRSQRGTVMPGQGRTRETENGVDVFLNDTTYWGNIPLPVWEYTLGGYQVLKKWLSYRERPVLGRDLKPEEARDFMHIARRIAALLALQDQLDDNYRAVTAAVVSLAALE